MRAIKHLFLALALMAGTTFAWAEIIDGINYYLYSSSRTAIVSINTSVTGAITIPVTVSPDEYQIHTYTVTSIGEDAFKNCSGLTSVTFEAGSQLASIEYNAFYNCTALKSINIPAGVTSIGELAFSRCTSLESVTFADGSQLSSIGDNAFDNCSGLTSITIPNTVTSIGEYAFGGCSHLTSVNIPTGVTSLPEGVFALSGIQSITIPNGVNSIGKSAFRNCTSLQSISIPSSVTSIGSDAFGGCSGLTSISIPASVTSIGSNAFFYCSGVTSITVDSSNPNYDSRNGCNAIIETATNKLLSGCRNTIIPTDVSSIGDNAFNGCTALKSINIPAGVTSIGRFVFNNCNDLADVTVNWTSLQGCTTDATAFGDLNLSGIKLHVPAGTYTTYAAANVWKNFNIIDPYGGKCGDNLFWAYDPSTTTLTITGSGAMYDYTDSSHAPWYSYKGEITSATMSADMTHLGNYAFYKCTALTSATFADGSQLTSIGKHAFDNCSALTSIEIPSSVTSLGGVYPDGAVFYKCSALTSVNIPDGITFIGDNTFYNCYSLSSVSIPNSVTQIGHDAFANCTTLVSVTIPAQVQYITNNMFNGCSGLETVTFAEGSELISLGNYAFYNCTKLSDLYVPWMANPLPTVSGALVFFGSTLANINLHLPFAAWSNYEAANIWKIFKQVPVVTAKADPNDAGAFYNTFYHGTVAYALPTGVEAYTAKRDGTNLILTKVAEAGEVLPADAAVILKSSVQQFEMTPSEETPVTVGENDLLGVDAAEAAPANCYVLSGPNPSNPDITEVGFYQFSGTLGAHKAYLIYSSPNPAPKRLRFVFESTQDIEGVQSTEYRVQKVLRDGHIYILRNGVEYNVNGQKVR